MTGITIVVISAVIAITGLVQSHSATAGARSILGLTPIGIGLVTLSIVGVLLGIVKEIQDSRAANLRDQLLKEVYAQVVGLRTNMTDQQLAQQLEHIADRIRATATSARESDFSLSDFSRSNFQSGNFTEANFQNALFRRANLRGADLHDAVVDDTTRLPTGK